MNKTLLLSCTIASILLLAACGADEQAAAPAAPAAPAAASTPTAAVATPAEEAANALGKSIYGRSCAMCHAAGVAGAPKPGDRADWEPRIAQGMETMQRHAIDGFSGAKGAMPARGGSSNLSDDEVIAAVAFMVDQSR